MRAVLKTWAHEAYGRIEAAFTPSHILTLTRAAFRQEANELLTELDTALLGLEAAPKDHGLMNRAFRATHTLKGGGATAGYDDVSSLLHGVEDVFNEVREGRLPVTGQLVDLALKVSDAIRRILQGPEAQGAPIVEEARGAVEALRALVAHDKEATVAPVSAEREEGFGGAKLRLHNSIRAGRADLLFGQRPRRDAAGFGLDRLARGPSTGE